MSRLVPPAARHWRLALVLYLPGALTGLLAAAPMLLGMRVLATAGPWPMQLADGGALNALGELAAPLFAGSSADTADAARRGALLGALASAALAGAGLLLETLTYAFLAGGVLERLVGGTDRAFQAACRRWFWPMLRFSLLIAPLFWVAVGLGVGLLVSLARARLVNAALLLALVALWLSLVNGVFEVGRASLVVHGERRAGRGVAHALGLLRRPAALTSATLAWLVLAALGLAQLVGGAMLLAAVPPSAIGVALIAGQAVALLGAWLKLLRLAVAVELAQRLAVASGATRPPSSTIPPSERNPPPAPGD